MLSTTTVVSRPATERRILDLLNAESATAWVMSFVANCHADKKEGKINTNGTVQDLQVTNLSLSMSGQDAIIKLRSLMSPRNLINTPYKDIRLAIQNYISPKERVVTAGTAKLLSVIQGVGESDDNFLARLREEARYCDFEKLKTAAKPEEELVKIKFISILRDLEEKLRLLDGIKTKPVMSVTEMTESLQFKSQAIGFERLSSGNLPFTVKEEVEFNFKKIFQKPNEKITANKNNNTCTRCGGKPHSSRSCPVLSKKCNTCENLGRFSRNVQKQTPTKFR